MFQLTEEEFHVLRFQIGISKKGSGGRRYLPYVFTEQGVAMLSSVLKSKKTAAVNVAIMRAFVKLREIVSTNEQLSKQLHLLEKKLSTHDAKLKKHQKVVNYVFEAIQELMDQPKKRVGF